MKTFLSFSFLALAASIPVSVAASFAGWTAPAPLSPVSLFSWFAATTILLVMAVDYRPLQGVPASASAAQRRTDSEKSAHPLAA